MKTTVKIVPVAAEATVELFGAAPAASNVAVRFPRSVPTFIGADEAYYWSFPWQQDVRESMAALAKGDFEEFASDDPSDVVRWFLSHDD